MSCNSSVQSRQFTEPEQITTAQGGVFCQLVPTDSGPFEAALHSISMGDVTLNMGQVSPCMGLLRSASDRALLQLPLEGAESLTLNGVPYRPGMIGTYAPGADLLRVGSRPTSFATLVLPSDAVETLLEPAAGSRLLQPGGFALIQVPSAFWDQAKRIIIAARATASTIPEVFEAEQPRYALRDALLKAAHDLVSPKPSIKICMPRSTQARRRTVLRADEYLRAHMNRPIYTEELCDALAVSTSSLADAFRSVFDITPHRFLKLRRMSMVRVALQSREGPMPLIKCVALAHGFWHLGQFAHDYRSIFGETPSDTLARGQR
ncbi:helix-turn-helix domain-containing protein [Dankookia sp. GCM10030260]|uniref:helix-turn-helix domain-containing protein n=1 Tax=Dankookia sp. GCM10030260 TaxID=3273390 RepID=UPI00360B2798